MAASIPYATMSDTILFDVEMPNTYKVIHTYCMKRLNITDWRLHPSDISKNIGRSVKTVRRAFQWFLDHGYGAKDNDGRWTIYPTPQIPVNPDPEPIEAWTKMSIVEPVLMDKNVQHIDKETSIEKETTTPEPITPTDPVAPAVVVVFSSEVFETMPTPDSETMPAPEPETIIQPAPIAPAVEEEKLEFPVSFTEPQKKDAKRTLKKLDKPELAQDILFELAYIITSGKVKKTIPACLHGLVNIANVQGHFTRTQAAGASNKGGKPHIPIWQGYGQSTPSKPEKAKGFIQQAKQALRGIAI
jgi:hypothetical protein